MLAADDVPVLASSFLTEDGALSPPLSVLLFNLEGVGRDMVPIDV